MRKFVIFALTAVLAGGTVQASWYWPFGSDSDAVDEKPKRVSELIEPASLLIEEASDLAAEDKVDEAIEKYRKALEELNRIEMENPDRAKGAEFATLRNKRAYVNAAIDSLLLGQVRSNAKVVAVSDTTELERRLDRERWGKRVEAASKMIDDNNLSGALAALERAKAGTTNGVQIAMAQSVSAGVRCLMKEYREAYRELVRARQAWIRAGTVSSEETNLVAEALHNVRARVVGEYEKSHRKAPAEIEKFDVGISAFLKLVEGEREVEAEANPPDTQVSRVTPVKASKQRPATKREQVMSALAVDDWTTARRLIGEMLVEKPNGAAALNLKAAMEAKQGKFKEAEATLDQAILSNPRSHFAYYNMANLMLQVRADDKSVAKRYYETGRTLGGPVDAHLEESFK